MDKTKKQPFQTAFKLLGWITVQNPHHFVDELIELGGFSKNLDRDDASYEKS